MVRAQAGFTLLEVMLSVAISATCLLGLTNLQISAQRANVRSRDLSLASAMAQSKLEEIARMDMLLLQRVRSDPTWASWRTEVIGGPDADGRIPAGMAPTPITLTVDLSMPAVSLGGVTMVTVNVFACWSEGGARLSSCAPSTDPNFHRLQFAIQKAS